MITQAHDRDDLPSKIKLCRSPSSLILMILSLETRQPEGTDEHKGKEAVRDRVKCPRVLTKCEGTTKDSRLFVKERERVKGGEVSGVLMTSKVKKCSHHLHVSPRSQ